MHGIDDMTPAQRLIAAVGAQAQLDAKPTKYLVGEGRVAPERRAAVRYEACSFLAWLRLELAASVMDWHDLS